MNVCKGVDTLQALGPPTCESTKSSRYDKQEIHDNSI